MSIRKLTTTILAILALIIFLQGCNTIRGAGEDIEQAGDAIEDAAQ